MSSRVLIGLAAAQTALLGFLSAKFLAAEARLDALQQTVAAAPLAGSAISTAAPAVPNFDAADLRRIVREELAAATVAAPATGSTPVVAARTPAPSPAASPAYEARVRQQLGSYIARGKMSAADMDQFYAAVAELPVEQRRQMMRELTNAMNSGKLDARM